jgi:Ca-activated chloride channel family protein
LPIPFLKDFQFAAPAFLFALLALPLLALVRGRRGPAPAIAFSPLNILLSLGPQVKSRFGRLSAALIYLALASGIIALARPQKVNSYETQKASGIEITLAIDVSLSMSIVDFWIGQTNVDRLVAAKHVIEKFVMGRPSDRIGVVIFSGRPHSISPLTMDHDWLLQSIEKKIHFDHNIEQGTAIGTAVAASAKRMMDREAKSKIIVLLTDGQQTTPGLSPQEAAKLASTLGIKVYTIAIGTDGTHYVPRLNNYMDQTFDFETLQEVADTSGGKAYQAKDFNALNNIFSEIDKLEKTEIATNRIIEAKDLFFPFLLAAAILTALSAALNVTLLKNLP